MLSKDEAVKIAERQRKESLAGLGEQYANTRKAIEFYNGDTMSYRDRVQFMDTNGAKKSAVVQFNDIQSPVDSVIGFMAQNRRRAVFVARSTSTQEQQTYSRAMNDIHGYVRENANADQVETDQDADMMINGYGAIETDISYVVGNATRLPGGEIIKCRLNPESVGWDPKATAKNLLDARWVYYFDEFDLKDALDLFDKSKRDDFAPPDDGDTETGYVPNPEGGFYDRIREQDAVEWASKDRERVRVYNHQFFMFETFYRVKNPLFLARTPEEALLAQARMDVIAADNEMVGPEGVETEDLFAFNPSEEILTLSEKQNRLFVAAFGPEIRPISFKRKVFYTVVYSGKHAFSVFRSISQQGFSVKFKTGVFNASKKIWVGMVNSMMEPAEYKNKALTELMFTIAANSKGGVLVEEDAVKDIAEFEKKWARTDAVVVMRSGALAQGKLREKARPAVGTGLEGIIQLSDASLQTNGVDPAFVGDISEAQQSGILYKRRIRQVISKMARYFDSLALYQKEDARLCADLIRVWVQNNEGELVRITGEKGEASFMMLSEDALAAEYDVDIEEAPQTPEDKEQTAQVLGMYADKLASVGNSGAASAFYAESLQYLPVDGDVRQRLVKALTPSGDDGTAAIIQELQAQIAALTSEAARAEAAKVAAEAELSKARAEKERVLAGKAKAETLGVLESARQTSFENDLMQSGPVNVNVSI